MTERTKRKFRPASRIAALVLLLLISGLAVLQFPYVQKAIADKVSSFISEKLDGRLECQEVIILPFNAVLLKNVCLIDPRPYVSSDPERQWPVVDTVFKAETITAGIKLSSLFGNGCPVITRVHIDNAYLKRVVEPGPRRTRYGMSVMNNISRILKSNPDKERKQRTGEVIKIRKIRIKNFTFGQQNYSKKAKKPYESGINWKNFALTIGKGTISNFCLIDGHSYGEIVLSSISEKCGYVLDELSMNFDVTGQSADIGQVRLADSWSDVRLDSLNARFDNTLCFRSFPDKVKLDAQLAGSNLDTRTLNAFCGRKAFQSNQLNISKGRYCGYVRDFKVSSLVLSETRGHVSTTFDLSLRGLPDKLNADISGKVSGMKFTPKGLTDFLGTFSKKEAGESKLSDNSVYLLNCDIEGKLNAFDCNVRLDDGRGWVDTEMKLNNVVSDKPIAIDGRLGIFDLDAGKLINNKLLSRVNLETELHCILSKGNPVIYVKGMQSDGITVAGMNISSFTGYLSYVDKVIDGKLSVNDPKLEFSYEGSIDLSDKRNPEYDFFSRIRNANLSMIKAFKKPMRISADIAGKGNRLIISDLSLADSSFRYPVGSGDVRMTTSDSNKVITVRSNVIDLDYEGRSGFGAMIHDLKAVTTWRELPALCKTYVEPAYGGDYHMYANFKQPRLILPHFAPSLFFSDSTELNLDIVRGNVSGHLHSHRLALGKDYIKGIDLDLDNGNGRLNTVLGSEEIKIREISFIKPTLTVMAQSDSVSTMFHYDVPDKDSESSDIFLNASLSKDYNDSLRIVAHTLPSGLMIGEKYWNIFDSDIKFEGQTLSITDLRMLCDNQFITVDGGLSRTLNDTLLVRVNDLGLKFANKVSKYNHNISGTLNASAIVTSPIDGGFNLMGLANVDTLFVGGNDIGSLDASASWDPKERKIVFLSKNVNRGNELMNLQGYFKPGNKDIDATLALDSFELASVSPFLEGRIGKLSGLVHGNINLRRKNGVFKLQSHDTRLDSARIRLNATDAEYVLNGPFKMSGDTVRLDMVDIRDLHEGKGHVNGALVIKKDKKSQVDISVRLDRMNIINRSSSGTNSFSGKLDTDCSARLFGTLDNLKLEADAASYGRGNVHISLANGSNDKKSDLLSFKERERYIDPYEELLKTLDLKNKKTSSALSLEANVRISPDVEAVIELDKDGNNIITASGTGSIRVDSDAATGAMMVDGLYTISSGKMKFSLLNNLINKNFTLKNGGYIKLNGDLNNSDIDITADYSLKTSISPLIADTSSITTRKKVVCGLRISNKISNPQLSFSINVEDLDPSTRSLVESALNTQEKIQKQFVSLLVTGNFIQDDQGGVYFSQSNIIYKNLSDIMSGQLNNILQKLDIPLDLGLNYIESQTGQNAFDVAVSTQFFNNRLIVNGSFGNRRSNTSSNNDMVGNLDIEVKIDKSGEFRFTAFSHSPDAYSSWLDKAQRNGIGLTYQKEYTSFKNLFKNMFIKKEERDKIEAERVADMAKNRKTVKIE